MAMNSLTMRSSKMKFLIYGCVICGMVLTVYLLSSTHSRLKNVKGAYDTCSQQKDSLLAQLQVVYEQKSRVEKSLQKEKLDHRKTSDDYQENTRVKLILEREKQEAEGKFNNLQQEHQTLQDKYTQLTSESAQLKEKLSTLQLNLHKYQTETENVASAKDDEIKKLSEKIGSLELTKEQLRQNYNNQAKDVQNLMVKLHTLQTLNSNLQEKAQELSEVKIPASQNDRKKEIPDTKVKESNVVDGPEAHSENGKNPDSARSIGQPNQEILSDKLKPLGGGEDSNIEQSNKLSSSSPTNNGEGAKSGGGKETSLNNELPKNNAESNDMNEKLGDLKSQVQAPDENKEKVSVQTLAKPKNSETHLDKDEANNDPPKEIFNKDEQSQVLPQPNNFAKEVLPDIKAEDHHQEQGEVNVIMPWGSNLKRGPQLKQQDPLPQGNHPNEDDDYREEVGDDDAAEEDAGDDGVPGGDKNALEKHFQDHDFEDNEGDQNRAKEEGHNEGVVVQPK